MLLSLNFLCSTSNVRPQAGVPQVDDETAPSNNNESSVVAYISQTQNLSKNPTQYHVQDQIPTHVDWSLPVLDSLPGIGQPFGSQINPGNLFAFNDAFDFPYIPDPTLPLEARSHNLLLRSYPSADFDAFIGPELPMDFDNTNPSPQSVNNLQAVGNKNAMPDAASGTPFAFSPNMMDPSQSHRPQAPPHDSSSHFDGLCSINTASTVNGGTAEGGGRNNAQREELLVNIGRLVELAASMQ
jgi:hypothetical protein